MPKRYLLIIGAFALSILMWVDRACISAAKGDMQTDLGFSDTEMGWVMSIFALGYALFQVPAGSMADRYGPRRVMTSVVMIWSALTALTGVVRGYGAMLLLRFTFGMGEAGGYPTLARAFTQWLPMNERGITNSISFSGGRLGAALAMPGVVALIELLGGWQPTFWFFGAIGIFFAIVWWLLFRDSPESHPAVSAEEAQYIAENRRAKRDTEKPSPSLDEERSIGWGEMFASNNLRLLMFQYVAHNFTFFFTVSWFFPYMKETYKLTSQQTGWYAAAPLLCGVVGNWLAGFTVDRMYSMGRWRWSRRLPAICGFVLAAVGMTLCVNMPSALTAVICMCIAIFGSDMILSPSWSTCMDIGGSSAGKVSGSMNMIGNLGSFATSLAFPYLVKWSETNAYLAEWFEPHEPFFYLAGGLNLLAIFAWCMIRPDVSMKEELAS
ncbi:MAG: MFS transporter [Planctomycetota bacterium]